MNEVEEIRQRLDIVDIVSQYVTLKKAGANYKGVCPFHQEKTASFMVSPSKQIWKCFGCGKGGDCYSFMMNAEHLEFADALRLLAQKAGVTLKPRTKAEHQSQSKKESIYRVNELVAKIFEKILWDTSEGKIALKYLSDRGLDEATIKKFRIGFASKKYPIKPLLLKKGVSSPEISAAGSPERFYQRIMFPIFDVMGHVIGFTGRSLDGSEPKYINSPETALFNKSRILYGLNFAKGDIKDADSVVLVEGQFDVISLMKSGIGNVVASSGTAITENQIQILSKYTNNFLIAFDNDSAGVAATRKVIEILLAADLNVRVVETGKYKDVDEMVSKDAGLWSTASSSAKESIDYLIDKSLDSAGDIRQIENKKKVLKDLLQTVKLVSDPARLDYIAQRLAVRLGLSVESIVASISKVKFSGASKPGATKSSVGGLTNEEQLLAIILHKPSVLNDKLNQLDSVVWMSVDAQRIAEQARVCYNDKALVKNHTQFLASVKNQLDSQTAQKIDSWMFWLSDAWGDMSEAVASELIEEKFSLMTSKDRESQKAELARQIRLAQESNDSEGLKKLMDKLNNLTKEGSA